MPSGWKCEVRGSANTHITSPHLFHPRVTLHHTTPHHITSYHILHHTACAHVPFSPFFPLHHPLVSSCRTMILSPFFSVNSLHTSHHTTPTCRKSEKQIPHHTTPPSHSVAAGCHLPHTKQTHTTTPHTLDFLRGILEWLQVTHQQHCH